MGLLIFTVVYIHLVPWFLLFSPSGQFSLCLLFSFSGNRQLIFKCFFFYHVEILTYKNFSNCCFSKIPKSFIYVFPYNPIQIFLLCLSLYIYLEVILLNFQFGSFISSSHYWFLILFCKENIICVVTNIFDLSWYLCHSQC